MTKASDNPFPSILLEDHADPAAPTTGYHRLFVDTDEKLKMIDHASLVTDFTPAGGFPPGYEYDYVQKTSATNVTARTEATADTIVTANAVAFDGSTAVIIEFFAAYVKPGANMLIWLYDGASSIGAIGCVVMGSGAGICAVARARITPSNATHTYSIRCTEATGTGVVDAGAGGAGVYYPTYIRITKV